MCLYLTAERKMLDSEARKQFQKLLRNCAHYRILCQIEELNPSIVVMGDDAKGNRLLSSTTIDFRWVSEASCLDQFVAAVIESLRELLGIGKQHEQRKMLLGKIFVHAELLPHLERKKHP